MEEEPAATRFIRPGTHKGKGLAVFTSGGDSQGFHLFFNQKHIKVYTYCLILSQV